jgi:hypothetical protein
LETGIVVSVPVKLFAMVEQQKAAVKEETALLSDAEYPTLSGNKNTNTRLSVVYRLRRRAAGASRGHAGRISRIVFSAASDCSSTFALIAALSRLR